MIRDFKVIAAIGLNTGIIGSTDSNSIPWRIPSDLAFFKATTLDSTIVMGSRTYESLNNRNLPRRRSVVLTRNPDKLKGKPHAVYNSFEDVLKYEDPNLFVIGGSQIYQECLKFNPKTFYLTVVDDIIIRPERKCFVTDVVFPTTGDKILYDADAVIQFGRAQYAVSSQSSWLFENGFGYKFVELNAI